MSDLNTFCNELDRDFAKILTKSRKAVVKVAFDGHRNIATETPFDTGLATASWQLDLNGTNENVEDIEALSKQAAEAIAGKHRDKLKQFKLGDVIHIFNNTEYVLSLEFEGSSKQAPAGWVRSEKIRMENKLNEAFGAIR